MRFSKLAAQPVTKNRCSRNIRPVVNFGHHYLRGRAEGEFDEEVRLLFWPMAVGSAGVSSKLLT